MGFYLKKDVALHQISVKLLKEGDFFYFKINPPAASAVQSCILAIWLRFFI